MSNFHSFRLNPLLSIFTIERSPLNARSRGRFDLITIIRELLYCRLILDDKGSCSVKLFIMCSCCEIWRRGPRFSHVRHILKRRDVTTFEALIAPTPLRVLKGCFSWFWLILLLLLTIERYFLFVKLLLNLYNCSRGFTLNAYLIFHSNP